MKTSSIIGCIIAPLLILTGCQSGRCLSKQALTERCLPPSAVARILKAHPETDGVIGVEESLFRIGVDSGDPELLGVEVRLARKTGGVLCMCLILRRDTGDQDWSGATVFDVAPIGDDGPESLYSVMALQWTEMQKHLIEHDELVRKIKSGELVFD